MKLILLALTLLLLLSACHDNAMLEKYGAKFDRERKKIGLPHLDSRWKLAGNESDGLMWINSLHSDTGAYYFKKSMYIRHDTLISEDDEYIGPHRYKTIDGSSDEDLWVSYHFRDYRTDMDHKKGWECKWTKGDGRGGEENVYLSIDSATLLLRSWGIERLK